MKLRSGIPELDRTLCGGFEKGSLSIIIGEGEMSGKTTTLTYLANKAVDSGSNVAFISFEDDTEVLAEKIVNPYAKLTYLEPKTKLETLQLAIAGLSSDLIVIDDLSQIDCFQFNAEAVSVLHNLRVSAMMCSKAIVAGVGIFPENDIVKLLRMSDVAMDIQEFHHNTYTLGVLKNSFGKAGFSLSFGVAH
jgi:predicted ATP-dependent serine protease